MKNKIFVNYYKEKLGSLKMASHFFRYSKSSICQWLSGKTLPGPRAIRLIAKKTSNAVAPESWYK
jgi:hypothetical protein